MNSSFRRSERNHSSSRAYEFGDTIINNTTDYTTNNNQEEFFKNSTHDDTDLLNIASINNNLSSSSNKNIENDEHINNNNRNMYNNNNNLIDLSDQTSLYNVDDNVLFKKIPSTIVSIIKPTDPFKDATYVIRNNIGMTKVVTIYQIELNNIPRDITFSIPSASASLYSIDISYISNYTKRSSISSQSQEIINKFKQDLKQSKQALQDIERTKTTNNIQQPSYLQIPVARLVDTTYILLPLYLSINYPVMHELLIISTVALLLLIQIVIIRHLIILTHHN